MSWLRVGDLDDSTHSRPEDHGHVRVRYHHGDGLLTAYMVVIDCERRRVIAYTQDGTRGIFGGQA